jgi:hypothetical protein
LTAALTGWEPRRNILDKKMLRNFESDYIVFDEGVDVLETRDTKLGKRKCLLPFHGRLAGEDSWVAEELLSPCLEERATDRGLGYVYYPIGVSACHEIVQKYLLNLNGCARGKIKPMYMPLSL